MTSEDNFLVRPIGIIHSPFQEKEGMPIQPGSAQGQKGKIALDREYVPGLQDLEGFSHLILVYYFHRAKSPQLLVKPFLDDDKHGLFATRAPSRPNPIGISIVKLLSIQDNILEVENLDILDGTPLLDIKPYVPDFDQPGKVRIGWLNKVREEIPGKLSDDSFS
ncbi:MAG: tRNA (N6-threonylcarbamoyladenosine(37)-N6)-methyltransferase TrmO [Anaerolineales bacterium]